jgi:hypothetical protein
MGQAVLKHARTKKVTITAAATAIAKKLGTRYDTAVKAAQFVAQYPDGLPAWLKGLKNIAVNHLRRSHVARVPVDKRQALLEQADREHMSTDVFQALLDRTVGPSDRAGGRPPKRPPADPMVLADQAFSLGREFVFRLAPDALLDKAWPDEINRRNRVLVRQLDELRDLLARVAESAARLDGRLAMLLGEVADLQAIVAAIDAVQAARATARVAKKGR